MTNTQAPTISDVRFNKLKAKLRELFELDKSDLDFGIYRIIAAKNKEVTDFLDRQLKDVVRKTLAEHGSGETDAIRTQLDETIANLRNAEVPDEQIETNKKVTDLRAQLAAAGGKTGEELEADIYNHLLAFFGRYYDEGDFISQRRYKGDTYAIPYSGEEVTLHWANKDQYYIKSGEWHKDYRFKLADGRRVRFSLVDATQETGNNKEPDESKRRYILIDDDPVAVEGDTLVLRFHFKAPTDAEKQRAADGPVAIFGGDYAKDKAPKKGDERTQFAADAEQRALQHIPDDWKDAITQLAATDDKPKRTLLGKHLDTFTARNTFDYFIHKDLGGFLHRELDFYIKNEVVRLDDLDSAPANHLQQIQGRVKAIRKVAANIIDLLASMENFQKKLWLKKKFVLNTSWLVTVDRVPDKLRDIVAKNKAQWAEWERLGFKPDAKDKDTEGLFKKAKWATRAYLDACDKLVVDTRLFDPEFTSELLASEEILGGLGSITEALTGLLVHSENFQALRLLNRTYRKRIDCVYIDPPFNLKTNGDFVYRTDYKDSTWSTLLQNRLEESLPLFKNTGFQFLRCDINGNFLARTCLDLVFGSEQLEAELLVQRIRKNTTEQGKISLPLANDSLFLYAFSEASLFCNPYKKLRTTRKAYWRRIDDSAGFRNPPERVIFGATFMPYKHEAHFKYSQQSIDRMVKTSEIRLKCKECDYLHYEGQWTKCPKCHSKRAVPQYLVKDSDQQILDTNWLDIAGYAHTTGFSTENALVLLQRSIELACPQDSVVLDYFAGSGTTAHAVLNLARNKKCARQFVLIEMGKHFETVLRPRIECAIYCSKLINAKAQTHNEGLSALVKCFAVESYDDALNNLPTPSGAMFAGRTVEETDALIRYALDLELGPSMLDLDIFRDPWGYAIDAQLAGEDEVKRHKVDLVETFNYLLGLKVTAYGPIERYTAAFERAEHDDDLGKLKIKGRLKRDPQGPFVFQRVEGVLNDANDTRVLVVWRKLTDGGEDPEAAEKDAAVLEAWMSRHREVTTERTEHRDYHEIYVNGPVTLPQPGAQQRRVYPIEEAFKRKMFEDTEGTGD